MAVTKNIPKDIRQYEAKLIGAFTVRQTFCLIPAAVFSILILLFATKVLPRDICILLVTIVDVPFILLGWFKPYGMPFEKFIKTILVSAILSPKHRKYKTLKIGEATGSTPEKTLNASKSSSTSKRYKPTKSRDPELKRYL